MFERLERMVGKEVLDRLQNTSVLLIGVGGVGGYALEALVRSGIGSITIWDFDVIEETNLNRQIITNINNLGCLKAEEARKRALFVNPNCQVEVITSKLLNEQVSSLDFSTYHFVIDACDDVLVKVELMKRCLSNHIPFISCMGTGNRIYPEFFQITTLAKTCNDPLAKRIRSILRKENIDIKKIPVVWSRELPIATESLGTCCPVPMSAGSLLASYVIRKVILKEPN